jgi:general secretion pathway protein N
MRAKEGSLRVLALGAVLGLLGLNAHLLLAEIDTSPLPQSDAASAQLAMVEALPEELASAGAQSYPETIARPLFRKTRRPPEPDKPQIADPARAAPRQIARLPENLELVGIMKESGRSERALIRFGASPIGQWVEIGHVLEGWRLSRIDPGEIVFQAEGQEQRLTLHRTEKAQQ